MKNPFANVTQREWLYVAGAIASLIALALVFGKGRLIGISPGTQTDTSNAAFGTPENVGPIYTNYNTGPLFPSALVAPEITSAGPGGSCGCSAYDCAGPSQLDSGTAYAQSQLGDLLDFFKETNPNYAAAQKAQLGSYYADFSTGESYTRGAGSILLGNGGVLNTGPTSPTG